MSMSRGLSVFVDDLTDPIRSFSFYPYLCLKGITSHNK